jgi:hypothetical protein
MNDPVSKAPVLPNCASLAIGSLPHMDVSAAVDLMFAYKHRCPAWPQLPRTDFRENMYVQFSEGMPSAVIDADAGRMFFDLENAPGEMAVFYERYLAGEVDFCGISPQYARGFEELMQRDLPAGAAFIKGQVTGPSSFGLTVNDADGKPVLYHADLFEAVVKALALKGRWQVRRFREKAPALTPVIFFDEPYLTQIGSALISLAGDQAVSYLNECYGAVDGLTGTHVCGGTDWGLLARSEVDILHFDAAGHWQEFFLYEKELAAFMERGGMIAWGIVPTSEEAFGHNASALAEKVLRGAEAVAAFGPGGLAAEDVLRRSFVSESCGTGSLSIELAEQCFSLSSEVSHSLAEQIC